MTLTNLYKTPWPWFGGKSDAAPLVWSALGDVAHYVEPFAGSLAVLLRRPHEANRSYHSETVNDFDGLLCNAWRAIAADPDAVAEAASWPVCEADLHARHLALLAWKTSGALERLMGDAAFYCAKMAGWWAWGQSCWIGGGWCSGQGPWIVSDDGRITKRPRSSEREPSVARQPPHVSNDGQGVNRPQTREPGVRRLIPHVSNDGQGVNRPQTREPGVRRRIPHVSDNGRGVNHAGTREPGVRRQLPALTGNGRGVTRPGTREPGVEFEHTYHPMTMPELRRWLAFLSARLRHVRVINGDWTRVCTGGVLQTLPVRQGGHCGVFLDPPYSGDVRDKNIYAHDDHDIARDVLAWCAENGSNPRYRIVLAGFDGEHNELVAKGWRVREWFRTGFLKGGMANTAGLKFDAEGERTSKQQQERLWISPHCLDVADDRQGSLFAGAL